MDAYALLFAATLNAGTVLAIAALGLLINEKAGIVNLGAEGMMLCAALAGFVAVVHTGSDWLGFAAGAGPVRCWRRSSACWSSGSTPTSTPRAGPEPVRRRILGVRRHQVCAGDAAGAPALLLPLLGDVPWSAPRCFASTPWSTLTIALVAWLIWFLYRSRTGLVLRSVGRSPESAHALSYRCA
jgi:simple sugar transport system permease protein